MSDRVNIQYSIKLDDLDIEVKRLIDRAHLSVEALSEGAAPSDKAILSLETLRQIAEYRQALADVDHILSDVMNIVNGFIEFRTGGVYNVGPEQVERQVREADAEPSLEQLQHKMQAFKDSLGAHDTLST